VISNLVTNAIRYGRERSAIDVRLRDEGAAVLLEVHNQGPPIPLELIPRLFDAFERGGEDDARRSGGLGLGLWIVQQIVTAHGGTIEVRSEEGDGTTFAVRWPRLAA
jgi:signal transduction histidine kinase